MAKTAMTHARLTPEIKEKAETILKELRKFNKSARPATTQPNFGLTADKEAWNAENNN